VLSIHLQVRAVEGAVPRRWLAQELNGVAVRSAGWSRLNQRVSRQPGA